MKTWTFGKRMAVGFGAVILIVLTLGLLSVWLMRQGSHSATVLSRDYAQALNLVADFNENVNDLRIHISPYVMTGAPDRLQALRETMSQLDTSSSKLSDHLKSTPTLAQPNKLLAPAIEKVHLYQLNVVATIQAVEAFKVAQAKNSQIGPKWNEAIESLYTRQYQRSQEILKGKPTPEQSLQTLHLAGVAADIRHSATSIRLINARGQAYRDPKLFAGADKEFTQLETLLNELEPTLKQPEDLQALADVRSSLSDYRATFAQIATAFSTIDETTRARNALARELKTSTDKLYENIIDLTIESTNSTAAQLNFGQVLVAIGIGIALTVAILLSLLITNSISTVLKSIILQLSSGASETAAAAEQLSTGSQSLAQGATEQAASLEQTSASMEEMTSMTKRNAEHALNAKALAQNSRLSAEKAAQDIAGMTDGMKAVAVSAEELSRAMNEIQSSSTAITQIMKSIDEIAFQTNILSLNAAVEAARAGEAGSGFAVVADEVRALATRSAKAAKETAKLIEQASQNSLRGVQVTQKVSGNLDQMKHQANQVSDSLHAIVQQVREVDAVIAEISTACQEQNQGIGQINHALTQMDKVTQTTAASAEESASAAEQVSAQAEESRRAVFQLQSLVGQNSQPVGNSPPPAVLFAENHPITNTPSPHASTTTLRRPVRSSLHPHPLPSRSSRPKISEVGRTNADEL